MARSPKVGVGLFAFHHETARILMGKRINPTNGYGHNLWQLPGGHAEAFEALPLCIERELAEETNLTIVPNNFERLSFEDGIDENLDLHYVECFFMAEVIGKLKNMEPNKCEGWEWFSLDNLPTPKFDCTSRSLLRNWSKLRRLEQDILAKIV